MKQIQGVLYNTDEGDRDCRMLPVGFCATMRSVTSWKALAPLSPLTQLSR